MPIQNGSLRAGLHLGGATFIGLSLIGLLHTGVESRISTQQRQSLDRHIASLLPQGSDVSNPKAWATIPPIGAKAGGAPVRVYPVIQGNTLVALLAEEVAPDGYNGTIKLLIGINMEGRLLGVRVMSHRETPGLGDWIDEDKSNWIRQFAGLSLDDPKRWAVKRDGGDFDQFAGATITPRAVVKAVRNTLLWLKAEAKSQTQPDEHG
ncbi:MAG: RnfABCDGE type electron transport complex subunit G [Methylococcaceae bacterium]